MIERREAFRNKDDKKYEEIVMKMTEAEQMILEGKMMEIFEKLGISQMEFQKSMQMYSMDPQKG